MKDEAGQDGEHEAFSRQDLYEEYKSSYLHPRAEVRPCRDPGLLERAARFLRGSPDLREAFTAFPFYRAVAERCADGTDSRRHLTGFIKATEMLESLCLNMFLQPWKKEIRSVKTFTGAFVYCLLPVLSSSTIESVLASIGYLPNSDASRSEFILSADVDADRALLLGFELLLARVECHHLLDLLAKHQMGPQEWLEVLQRRKQPAKVVDPTEKTIAEEWKDNDEEKKNELERKEEALHSETIPQPKQRRCHLHSVDHSVIELQMAYPDLAFRGRPLLPDQPHKAQPTMTSTVADGSSALLKTNVTREATAASPRAFSGDDGCNDRIGVRVTGPLDTSKLSFQDSDESRVDDDPLSGPPAISLVITPRAGPRGEASMKRGRTLPITASSDETQQKSSRENVMADKPESPSLSSTDEEQQLRALAERMGQLSVQGDEEKTTGRGDGTVREGDV